MKLANSLAYENMAESWFTKNLPFFLEAEDRKCNIY